MATPKLPPTPPAAVKPTSRVGRVREEPQGIVWPGNGSSTETVKKAFAAAAAGIDENASAAILKERQWRKQYGAHLVRHVELGRPSSDHALRSARQGLDFLYNTFRFSRPGCPTVAIAEAMAAPQQPCPFRTAEIIGTAQPPLQANIAVPWSVSMTPGKALHGAALERQLDAAAAQGLMESSVPAAIRRLHSDPSWRDTLKTTAFTIFGAGSAMGPLRTLLDLGATVVAVDIAVPAVWKRLIDYARASPGRLLFPVANDGGSTVDDPGLPSAAGCDITMSAPEVLDWLRNVLPQWKMVIGSYAYADGSNFPRVALAMDAVAQGIAASRPKGAVSLAYLCSPTDVFGIPKEAFEDSTRKRSGMGMGAAALWQKPLSALMMGKYLTPNVAGKGDIVNDIPIVDCLVSQQGPNYMMAKRLQHWRAMVARADGIPVSTNIAPASHTVSVRKARLLAAAYDGSPYFGIAIFHPETSAKLMTALLLHDLGFAGTVSDPQAPQRHPYDLFMHGAVHGGMWRAPWLLRSFVEVGAAITLAKEYKVPHVAAAASVAGVAYGFRARL